MRYLQNYQQHNEGIKSTLASIGLAGSLLAGSPDVKALQTDQVIQMQTLPMDGVQTQNMVKFAFESFYLFPKCHKNQKW